MDDADVVQAFDAIVTDRIEDAHQMADELLLKAVSPEVRAAYDRLFERAAGNYWYV